MASLPFLTVYDPPGTSEGTLDPMALYQIADQLGTKLVPAVRERMQRIRFLTAMSIGTLVTESIDWDPSRPGVPPFLVWEWIVVESIVRSDNGDRGLWGVPGTLVTQRALAQLNYVDQRSYLKNPRIFGFHAVYKRLAIHLGLVDVHLGSCAGAEELVDAWAKGFGAGNRHGCSELLGTWTKAVQRSLNQSPARTFTNWSSGDWAELAGHLAPHKAGAKERRYLRDCLLSSDARALGALPQIWAIQDEFGEEYNDEAVHLRLEQVAPQYALLLQAIRVYEAFCRRLQNAFDAIRVEAQKADAQGYVVTSAARCDGFARAVRDLAGCWERARNKLGELDMQLLNLFDHRFRDFAEPMAAAPCALAICAHHEKVQKAKSADGKRPWFDRLASDRIYLRHSYRIADPESVAAAKGYVHDYRALPIRRFYRDVK